LYSGAPLSACPVDMLSLQTASLSYASAPLAHVTPRTVAVAMQSKEELGKALNPVLGYFDPLGLAEADFWSQGNDATWGFLRQAEIKHGRVAMFAFCGYVVQANGITFPQWFGPITTGATPEEQWFNLSIEARCQIIAFIGFFEFWDELSGKHYMRGGRPGEYPPFEGIPAHKPLNLYDPLGFAAKNSPEKKAKGLIAEINNGRLAMIGIMGMVSASKVPGSVPGLQGIIKPFAGEVMAPLL